MATTEIDIWYNCTRRTVTLLYKTHPIFLFFDSLDLKFKKIVQQSKIIFKHVYRCCKAKNIVYFKNRAAFFITRFKMLADDCFGDCTFVFVFSYARYLFENFAFNTKVEDSLSGLESLATAFLDFSDYFQCVIVPSLVVLHHKPVLDTSYVHHFEQTYLSRLL